MHMGAMAVIGAAHPDNLIHIVLNNEAHESVGGMPTSAGSMDLPAVARACGYSGAVSVSRPKELDAALEDAKNAGRLTFIEVKCAIGSRGDLSRPDGTPRENKAAFMAELGGGI